MGIVEEVQKAHKDVSESYEAMLKNRTAVIKAQETHITFLENKLEEVLALLEKKHWWKLW